MSETIKFFAINLLAIFFVGCTTSSFMKNHDMPMSGVIAYYAFSGNPKDQSINTNNGIVHNAILTPDRFNNPTNAYSFNGRSSYIEINDAPSLRPDNISLEAWIKFDAIPSGIEVILAKTLGSGTFESYVFWMAGQCLNTCICDTDGYDNILSYNMNLTTGTWYHVAYTFNASAHLQTLYVGGNPVASGAVSKSIAYDSHPLTIGAEYDNERLSYFIHATIDDVCIRDVALSEKEIKKNFIRGSKKHSEPLSITSGF